MIVGEASVRVRADTSMFDGEVEAGTAPAFAAVRKEADVAGKDAGVNLRKGVTGEAGKLEGDLTTIGASAGGGLRRGVSGESSKIGEDLAKDGKKSGEGFSKGLIGALGLLSTAGVPVEALESKTKRLSRSMDEVGPSTESAASKFSHFGGVAALGLGAAAAGVVALGVDLAEGMQKTDATIASSMGISTKAAVSMGNTFVDTAGKSEYSGQEMGAAFAAVAGTLKATEGHALSNAQALGVMTAAGDLATAKQIDLGDATSALAGVMQAFQVKADGAAKVTDVLYNASTETGMSVDSLAGLAVKAHGKLGDMAGSVGNLSALLVDLTKQGITGRAMTTVLTSGLSTLQKTAEGTSTAIAAQKQIYDQLSPSAKNLADLYVHGQISSTDFSKASEALGTSQSALLGKFVTANSAVETAQEKYKQLGVTVFDGQGKFVGMGSIISQLSPKFAGMDQEQKLAAASTLFGASAAKQMVAVIQAGPAAYDKASASVNKMGTAHAAAAGQSKTLHNEMDTLGATVVDEADKVGSVLIPIVTKMVGEFQVATTYVIDHKAVLIALAGVVGGILTTAITVFTVNKMVSFGHSFTDAAGHINTLVTTTIPNLVGKLTGTSAQLDSTGTKATEMGGTVQAAGTEADTAMTGVAASAEGMAEKVGVATAATDAEMESVGVAATGMAGTVAAEATTTEGAIAGVAAESTVAAGEVGAALGVASGGMTFVVAGLGLAVVLLATHWKTAMGDIASATQAIIGPVEGEINSLLNMVGLGSNTTTGGVSGASSNAISQIRGMASGVTLPSTPGETAASVAAGTTGAAGLPAANATHVTPSQLEALWIAAGGPASAAKEAAEISSQGEDPAGDPRRLYGNTDTVPPGTTPGVNIAAGLWQILGLPPGFTSAQVLTPAGNAAAAVAKYKAAGDTFQPWAADKVVDELGTTNTVSMPTGLPAGNKAAADQLIASAPTTSTSRVVPNEHGGYGFTPDLSAADIAAGGNYTDNQEPLIAQRLDALGKSLHIDLMGISGYRTPAYSVSVGGFADDPHTKGEASDTQGAQTIPEATLEKFGLTRPFPGAAEADHIQLLPGTAGAPSTATTVMSATQAAAQRTAAEKQKQAAETAKEAAAARAKVDTEIAQTSSALAREVAAVEAGAKGGTAIQKEVAAATIANDKAVAGIKMETEAASLAGTSETTKVAITKQTADQAAASKQLTSLLTAIHSGALGTLKTAVTGAHTAGLASIEKDLTADHSTALAGLSKELVDVHRTAMQQIVTASRTAAATAAEKQVTAAANAQATAITTATAASGAIATSIAQAIADKQKISSDQAAETGLAGPALNAAQAQTNLDTVTQAGNEAIAAAQAVVEKAASESKLQQAHAAAALAGVQNDTTIATAQAQAALDAANAVVTQAAAQATAITQAATTASNVSSAKAQAITDQAKVSSDIVAQVGLTGTAAVVASAQTQADQTAAANDAAVAMAQAGVDAAAGQSVVLQAQAGSALAAAQGAAAVTNAQAQAVLSAAQAQLAAEQARATQITQAATTAADVGSAQAQAIADTTKVQVDKIAAVGLSGLQLTAANDQTALDQVVQTTDATVAQAQAAVDAAANQGPVIQAQAAAALSSAQSTQKLQEAQAQATLDLANATASNPYGAENPNQAITLNLYGNTSATDLMTELTWALRVGTLAPVAATPNLVAA